MGEFSVYIYSLEWMIWWNKCCVAKISDGQGGRRRFGEAIRKMANGCATVVVEETIPGAAAAAGDMRVCPRSVAFLMNNYHSGKPRMEHPFR